MDRHMFRRALFGLVLIAAGVLFLLQQAGMITLDIGYLFRTYWPLIIIYVGLHGLVAQSRYGGAGAYIWNIIIVLVGLMFLGRTTTYFPDLSVGDIFKYIVPIALIAVGLTMFLRPSRCRKDGWSDDRRRRREEWKQEWKAQKQEWKAQKDAWKEQRHHWHAEGDDGAARKNEWSAYEHDFKEYELDFKKFEKDLKDGTIPADSEPPAPPAPPSSAQSFPPPPRYEHFDRSGGRRPVDNRSGFLGDIYVGRDYWELAPLNVSHFIGDIVIDLTKAQIPFDETRINVSSFIGDVKVFVPSDMELEISVTSSSLIGDTTVFDRRENGFFRSFTTETPHYPEAEKRIKLNVSLFIGDIKVQRVG